MAPDFPAPIDRQRFEKLSIDYLQRFWNGRIPKVIHYDNKNNILIITDVGSGTKLLAEEIEKGKLHLSVAKDLGKSMAQLHFPTYSKNNYPVRGKKANHKHIDFIFDFRLRGSKETMPKETEKLFKQSLRSKTSIIYGDWASKNMFVAGKNIRIVDFENLVRFDPAFDIGYALAHWLLELNKKNKIEILRLLKDFETSYSNEWKVANKKCLGEIMRRASKYTGAMMLHRLAGVKNTNRRDEYLKRDVDLIKVAKHFLQGNFGSPSAALKRL